MEENPVQTQTIEIVEENLDVQAGIHKEDKKSPNESEYDSAGSYSEEGEYKERNDESDGEIESEADEAIVLERQEGDGEESIPQKKVDDDEDKKNPQYIPKRGTFYEHDDRTAEDAEEVEEENKEKLEKDGKKKLWQDQKERWSHDRFNDQEQAPKSKSELVQIYGYDIRNEDLPPRARRRRRYGRGPNKYTRNWEDEDAYNRPAMQRPKRPQNPPSESTEEFPPLEYNNRRSNRPSESSYRNRDKDNRDKDRRYNQQNSKQSEEREEIPQPKEHLQSSTNTVNVNEKQPDVGSTSTDNKTPKIGSGRVAKQQNESPENRNIKPSDYKGFTTKSRMGRNFKNQNSNRNHRKDDFIQSQNFTRRVNGNSGQQELEDAVASMSIQDTKTNQGKGQNNQRQGSVPPRLQGEQKGSKRYSSIRQRSLPETNNPIIQHSNYYGNEMTQSQQSQNSIIHSNPNLLQTPAGITQLAAAPALPINQQGPVTATPILQAPPQFAPPFPQPPAFIQAAVPPPTYLPQQAPPLINYVQTPPQYPAGYQSFQAPFNPVTQSTELYQPQGGITYYSTDQQITQRMVPLKRPKAAIPIVAPPASDLKMNRDEDQSIDNGSID